VTFVTFDKHSNGRRTAVESNSNPSCNHRISDLEVLSDDVVSDVEELELLSEDVDWHGGWSAKSSAALVEVEDRVETRTVTVEEVLVALAVVEAARRPSATIQRYGNDINEMINNYLRRGRRRHIHSGNFGLLRNCWRFLCSLYPICILRIHYTASNAVLSYFQAIILISVSE